MVLLLKVIFFLICYFLPILGTLYSRNTPKKWITYWLLVLLSRWTLIPCFELLVEDEGIMLVMILLNLGLIMFLNAEKV